MFTLTDHRCPSVVRDNPSCATPQSCACFHSFKVVRWYGTIPWYRMSMTLRMFVPWEEEEEEEKCQRGSL